MRSLYLWNPVFKRVMDIKDAYLKTHSKIDYNSKDLKNDCFCQNTILHQLVLGIEDVVLRQKYIDWLNTLKITQNGSRVLLHYDLIASSDMWKNPDHINIEARSIFIDIEAEDIVLCPMKKFFNINETPETSVENVVKKINEARIFEVTNKLDGSNQNASWYNGEVVLCGSEACDIAMSYRMALGYELINANPGYTQMLKDYPNFTFCFELIHPLDQHVVSYSNDKTGLYLLCMRNKLDGSTLTYKEIVDIANKYGCLHTDIEEYTIDELFSIRNKFKVEDKEGWVLNIDGFRVKFKTDAYLAMHSMFSNRSLSKILIKEIADGTIDDFMANMPSKVQKIALPLIDDILNYVKNMETTVNKYYNDYKNIEDKKEFAITIQKNVPKEYCHYLFELRQGKDINYLSSKIGDVSTYKSPSDIGIENVVVKLLNA